MAWDDTKEAEDQKTRTKASDDAGVPTTTPTMIGAIYVDTTNLKIYVATGTSSSADWKKVVSQ